MEMFDRRVTVVEIVLLEDPLFYGIPIVDARRIVLSNRDRLHKERTVPRVSRSQSHFSTIAYLHTLHSLWSLG